MGRGTVAKQLRAMIRLLGVVVLSILLNCVLLLLPGLHKLRSQISSFFFKVILIWCGIRVDSALPDVSNLTKKRLLIVSNHVSYLDILIISSLHPCNFLAKSEVGQWPLFGWVARALGCVFVKRDSLMGRACALRSCLKSLTHSSLALFPEGTTTAARTPNADAWAKGHAWIAQRSGADAVLCIGLVFENQSERAWTDDMSLIPHLLKTLGERKIHVKINGSLARVSPQLTSDALSEITWQNVCSAVNNVCPQ